MSWRKVCVGIRIVIIANNQYVHVWQMLSISYSPMLPYQYLSIRWPYIYIYRCSTTVAHNIYPNLSTHSLSLYVHHLAFAISNNKGAKQASVKFKPRAHSIQRASIWIETQSKYYYYDRSWYSIAFPVDIHPSNEWFWMNSLLGSVQKYTNNTKTAERNSRNNKNNDNAVSAFIFTDWNVPRTGIKILCGLKACVAYIVRYRIAYHHNIWIEMNTHTYTHT